MRKNRLTNKALLAALCVAVFAATAAIAQTTNQAAPSASGAIAVGEGPESVTSDGSYVFVANQFSNTVTKLRASDGVVVGTFAVGRRPVALAFDGANVWVANYLSNNVMKLDPATGTVVGTFAVGEGPAGLLCAGSNVWVANRNSNTVIKLR